jgi:hypothetical protein
MMPHQPCTGALRANSPRDVHHRPHSRGARPSQALCRRGHLALPQAWPESRPIFLSQIQFQGYRGISGAALASSPLWPRCAAIKTRPAFRFGVGEALKPQCRVVRISSTEKEPFAHRNARNGNRYYGWCRATATRSKSIRHSPPLSSKIRIDDSPVCFTTVPSFPASSYLSGITFPAALRGGRIRNRVPAGMVCAMA